MSQENPKEYWELFDQLKECRSGGNTKSDGCPIDDSEWISHYVKLLGPKSYDKDKLEFIRREIVRICNEPYFSELDFLISDYEIYAAEKTLKKGKAVGLDQIKNEMIKIAMPLMVKIFRNFFNAILCNQYYPKKWKIGSIVNLFKSGDIHNTDNYRRLTINSCLAKLFNTFMNNRLIAFLEKNRVICDNQIDFKKKARTSDHIFVMNTIFKKFCNANQKVYICFVDFRKAYDSIWRDALMLKLLRTGIRGKFFGVIENMYQGCEACIKSVMSPNLFNLYINDLPSIFEGDTDSPKLGNHCIHCLLYADDLVLLSLTTEGLQNELDKLNMYYNEWELNINVKKHSSWLCQTRKKSYQLL